MCNIYVCEYFEGLTHRHIFGNCSDVTLWILLSLSQMIDLHFGYILLISHFYSYIGCQVINIFVFPWGRAEAVTRCLWGKEEFVAYPAQCNCLNVKAKL